MPDTQERFSRRWATPEEPEQPAAQQRRTRLEQAYGSALHPFARATQLKDMALYWLPVSVYPMRSKERQWLLAFLNLLRDTLAKELKLRLESFLQFKSLGPEMMDLFLRRAQEYQPLAGISIAPGAALPVAPTGDDVEAAVKAGGPVDVHQWMGNYCYWFLTKQDEAQREDFFGQGAMMFLFMPPDPNTTPPKLEMPKMLRTHPSMKDSKIEQQLAVGFALKDKFLPESKRLFGAPLANDPSYPGLPFVAPLLSSEDFFRATPEDRAAWLELFEVYCIESPRDHGFLLAVKNSEFDETLLRLLGDMKDAGLEYPA